MPPCCDARTKRRCAAWMGMPTVMPFFPACTRQGVPHSPLQLCPRLAAWPPLQRQGSPFGPSSGGSKGVPGWLTPLALSQLVLPPARSSAVDKAPRMGGQCTARAPGARPFANMHPALLVVHSSCSCPCAALHLCIHPPPSVSVAPNPTVTATDQCRRPLPAAALAKPAGARQTGLFLHDCCMPALPFQLDAAVLSIGPKL